MRFHNSVIDSIEHRGVYLTSNSHNITFDGLHISNCGLVTGGSGLSLRADSNVIVNNCIIEKNTSYGIDILKQSTSFWGTPNERTRKVVISNNIITNNATHSLVIYEAEGLSIFGNTFKSSSSGTSDVGVLSNGNLMNISIDNNTFLTPDGINISQDTIRNIWITNNKFSRLQNDGSLGKLDAGITISGYTASNNVYVLNNVIDSCTTGIYISSLWTGDNLVVKGNEINYASSYYINDRSSGVSSGKVYRTERETKFIKIGITGETYMDYSLPNDGDSDENVITLTNILPAKCRIISVEFICRETLAGSGLHDILFHLGTSSSGEELIADASCDDGNEVLNTTSVLTDAIKMNWTAASSLYLTSNPDANWDTYTGGRWFLCITYEKYIDMPNL